MLHRIALVISAGLFATLASAADDSAESHHEKIVHGYIEAFINRLIIVRT